MNSPLEYGFGYKKLGLFEDARREFQRLKPGDADYVPAWCQLAWTADRSDRAELVRMAKEGLAMLSSGLQDPTLVDATADCLHLSGDSRAAYDLISKYCRVIKWSDTMWYGFATYASRCGKWSEAAWLLLLCLKHGGDAHMFFDLDLEPLFHHMAVNTPDQLSALALGHPLFTATLECASSGEVDHVMERVIPPDLKPLLWRNPKSMFFELRPDADKNGKLAFRAWHQAVSGRVAGYAHRATANSKAVILNHQLRWAVAAARRYNMFAARWHTVFALAERPDWIELFASRLEPLGMGYLFRDLRLAMGRDDQFCRAILKIGLKEKSGEENTLEALPEAAQGTGYEMIQERGAALARGDGREALRQDLLLMRHWPGDPSAASDAIDRSCRMQQWETASRILRAAPRSMMWFVHGPALARLVKTQEWPNEGIPQVSEPFYGQPDIGGLVRAPSAKKMALGNIWKRGICRRPSPNKSMSTAAREAAGVNRRG